MFCNIDEAELQTKSKPKECVMLQFCWTGSGSVENRAVIYLFIYSLLKSIANISKVLFNKMNYISAFYFFQNLVQPCYKLEKRKNVGHLGVAWEQR